MIRCRVARARIESALDQELSLSARFELEEHVAACSACAAHQRRTQGLQEWLEGPGDPPPIAPDVEGAVSGVFARLERGEGEAWRPPRPSSRRPIAVGLLALGALAAAVLALVTMVRRFAPAEPLPGPALPNPVPLFARPEFEWDVLRVELEVRGALLASFGSAGVDEARANERFQAATREPARSGWPVRRFVEGLLESPEREVVLAAARYLGALGDASAAPFLERTLARADVVDAVLDVLGAMGDAAVPALERALGRPELASRVLLQLCRIGGARSAAVLERAARAAREGSDPSREALLDALTATGPSAVACLLRLAADPQAPSASEAILARLPIVRGAGAELARRIEGERWPGDLAYRALLALRPTEALPWLEARCESHRERGAALAVLATYEGSAPLASALRLARSGRVPREEVLALLTGLFEREGERALDFTQELLARTDEAPTRAWLELLIESGHPAAARALVPLAFDARLADDDRQWAALAVGELGTQAEAQELLAALKERPDEERRLTAACLLSIHAQLGNAGVQRLFPELSEGSLRRVLAILDGRSGDAVLVHRVARALDGVQAELAFLSADKKATP